jgi:hypothetical protein
MTAMTAKASQKASAKDGEPGVPCRRKYTSHTTWPASQQPVASARTAHGRRLSRSGMRRAPLVKAITAKSAAAVHDTLRSHAASVPSKP